MKSLRVEVLLKQELNCFANALLLDFPRELLAGSIYMSSKILNYLYSCYDSEFHEFYCIKVGGVCGGFMHLVHFGDAVHLNNIVVRGDFRGAGLFADMMAFLVGIAKSKRKVITLDVDERNQVMEYYLKFGFFTVHDKNVFLIKKNKKQLSKSMLSYAGLNNRLQYENFGFCYLDEVKYAHNIRVGLVDDKFLRFEVGGSSRTEDLVRLLSFFSWIDCYVVGSLDGEIRYDDRWKVTRMVYEP